MQAPKDWYKDNFIISTNRSLLDVDAIDAALESDLLWWAKKLPKDHLITMLDHGLNFGLYVAPSSTADIAGSFHR
jgi:hypothetical protein